MGSNPSQGTWAALVLLAVSFCARVTAAAPTATASQDRANPQAALPVTAEELMPLEPSRGVYLVTEGSEKGKRVPFTFEPRGERWVLTKQGLAQHELHRDQRGNLVIDRETDLREERQIDYASPVMLLPTTMDHRTSLTGTTRVTVRHTGSRSVTYRGVCRWELTFVGVSPVETPAGTVPAYRLRARREIRLPLAQMAMTIDFEYGRGKGMIATGIEQVIHALGLFTNREVWRLEQLL
ncbi:MAG: hypothetical protein HYZ92_06050 [Candidatus Omnitrophica bacterium]|nr:hypothetical protein [Candidatus Omnitrophota bacterium]